MKRTAHREGEPPGESVYMLESKTRPLTLVGGRKNSKKGHFSKDKESPYSAR